MFMFGSSRHSFLQHYRCFPVSFIEKSAAEQGDKIFLPPSALNRLAQLHIEYPMLFRAENKRTGKHTHCGVLEFIADEGSVYIPYWMMRMLGLSEGDVLTLSNVSLPKGTYVKLQPHSKDFLDISNPRAVLETTLRGFSCLTVGDAIPIHYNDKVYDINIVEAKPSGAISVIETDCNVDFAPPLDYEEPSVSAPPSAPVSSLPSRTASMAADGDKPVPVSEEGEEGDAGGFSAFTGTGRRLDGKPGTTVAPVAPAPDPLLAQDTAKPARKRSGKLMFKDRLAAKFEDPGVSRGSTTKQDPKTTEEEDKGDGFKAFQGRSFSLK